MLPTPWQLCADTAPDGLAPAPDFPHCMKAAECKALGRCFLREWHGVQPHHMMDKLLR